MKYKISIKNILFLSVLSLIILLGIILRTHLYLYYPSFIGDESALFDNFDQKTFVELFLPLTNSQCCPPIFMILGKLLYSIFGLNEIAIRSLTYVSSILSILVFMLLTFKIFKNKFAIITANFIFCLAAQICQLMYFKQYQSDILFTNIILLVALYLKEKTPSYIHMFLLSILASLCVFCSYTCGFIIFCLILILFLKNNYKNKKQNLLHFLCFLIPFSIIMHIYFIINCIPTINDEILQYFWDGNPIPKAVFIPNRIEQIRDYLLFFTGHYEYSFNHIGLIILLSISFFLLFIKNKFLFCTLFMPFIFAYILGAAKLYPFAIERVSFYLIPIYIIIICIPLNYINLNVKNNNIPIEYGTNHKVMYKNAVSLIILSLFIYTINLSAIIYNTKDFLFKYGMGRKTNCKQFVETLYKSDITQNDYIYVDGESWSIFDRLDKEKKLEYNLKNNRIEDNPDFDKLLLHKLPIGKNIYFFIHEDYYYDNYERLKQWINDNCKIEYEIEEYYGNFVKCKKIK